MRRRSGTIVTTAIVTALAVAAVMTTGIALADLGASRAGSDSAKRQNLGNFDYGVCRGPDARCYNASGTFTPASGFHALLWTRPAGPRHADLGPPLGPGLDPPLLAANV